MSGQAKDRISAETPAHDWSGRIFPDPSNPNRSVLDMRIRDSRREAATFYSEAAVLKTAMQGMGFLERREAQRQYHKLLALARRRAKQAFILAQLKLPFEDGGFGRQRR